MLRAQIESLQEENSGKRQLQKFRLNQFKEPGEVKGEESSEKLRRCKSLAE